MLKDIVSNQKLQKEQLLTLSYIDRTKEPFAKKWLDTALIKVVLGPRRAGKSVFSLMLLKDRPFMYFNFDDEVISSAGGISTDELMKELHAAYGQVKTILFDEHRQHGRPKGQAVKDLPPAQPPPDIENESPHIKKSRQ